MHKMGKDHASVRKKTEETRIWQGILLSADRTGKVSENQADKALRNAGRKAIPAEEGETMNMNDKYNQLKEDLQRSLPEDVLNKVSAAGGDVEVCRILAENGIDLDEIEKKIEAAGFDTKRIGLQLSDDDLANVSGGFAHEDYGQIVCGHCGNLERNDFSRQFWASLYLLNTKEVYRCKRCGCYTRIIDKYSRAWYDPSEYDRKFGVF